MNTRDDKPFADLPESRTPDDVRDVELLLRMDAADARAASSARLARIAGTTWSAARPDEAPVPLVFVAPPASGFTPMRIAAMLAIGAGVLAAILASRTLPASSSFMVARGNVTAPQPGASSDTSDELAMFDTYLASADDNRSAIDAFVEDASDLEDRFDALSSGSDWFGDSAGGVTQGAS
jgi:hypothetical protein